MVKKYRVHIDYPWVGVPEDWVDVEIGADNAEDFPSDVEVSDILADYAADEIFNRVSWWSEEITDGEAV